MNDPQVPLNAGSRALLERLGALIEDRVRREVALAEELRDVTERAEAEYRATVELADERLRRRIDEINREHRSARERTAVMGTDRLNDLQQSVTDELNGFRRTNEKLRAHGSAKLDEALWLADTVVESGERKLKSDLDLARSAAESKRREFAGIRDAVNESLRRNGHRPMDEASGVAPGPRAGSAGTDGPKSIDDRLARASLEAQALRHAAGSMVGRWTSVLLGMLAGAGAALPAVWFGLHKTGREELAIGAGAGAILVGAVMLAFRVSARRRIGPARAALAATLADAEETIRAKLEQAELDFQAGERRVREARESEIQRARAEWDRIARQLERREKVEMPALEKQRRDELAAAHAALAAEQSRLDAGRDADVGAEQTRRDGEIAAALAKRDGALAALRERTAAQWTSLVSGWRAGVDAARSGGSALRQRSLRLCPAWGEPDAAATSDGEAAQGVADPALSGPEPDGPPESVRFGALRVNLEAWPGGLSSDPRLSVDGPTAIDLPAAIDMAQGGSLFVQHGPESRGAAMSVLRAVMTRLLAAFPPGKVRFTIVDPVGLGQNFAGFMHLADHDPLLVSDRIWTEAKHIEQKLTDLTEHMENVIQKYLRNEYQSIQRYNKEAGEIAEPFRFLVVADFPGNFTEQAARRLTSIVSAGGRCGVFTLVAADMSQKMPQFAPIADLERHSQTLVWKDGRFTFKDDVLGRWPLEIEAAPQDDAFNRLIQRTGRLAKDGSRVQVPFVYIAPREGELWSLSAAEELRIPLGRSGARKLQYLSLGRGTRQHALLAGRTGSGKSTLLHVMISNLALWYSPDEVELYLIDFKKGVEFKTYATHRLPHARVIAVESEREFAISVLRRLDAELTRRGQLFREAGVQDLPAFRAAAPTVMPRILLLVDEFQEFFTEDDKISQEAALLLDRLVRQGRAFGIHLVLGSQTLGGAFSIARATMGQMAVRIALQSSEADSLLIMSDDNTAPRLLTRPGEAIYNDASGAVEGNSPFQVAWLSDETRDAQLGRLAGREYGLKLHHTPPIIFEGNVPARSGSNPAFAPGAEPPPLPTVWLGEAVSIKPPTSVAFRRQSAANLLIVGQNEQSVTAFAILAISTLAKWCAAKSAPGPARLYVLDGLDTVRGSLASLPVKTRASGTRDAPTVIAELAETLKSREAVEAAAAGAEPGTTEAPAHEPVFLIVHGLQRFRDLRKGDDFSFGSDPDKAASASDQFAAILRDGPALGIHTIAWSDTVSSLERTLARNMLREFDHRVLYQMSQSDSSYLIDSPAAANLGANRAMLFGEESAAIEKFRPYAPDADPAVQ